jgi:hypothetical protein
VGEGKSVWKNRRAEMGEGRNVGEGGKRMKRRKE